MTVSRSEIAIDDLTDLVTQALAVLGLEGQDLEQVREVLFYAQLRDNSQGLQKILERAVAPPADRKPVEIVRSVGATLRIDGGQNPGMVVATLASDHAVELARTHGIGLVGTFNTSTSTGAIGYYAERMAADGMIGIVVAGSPKVMAMAGGIDPVFGTNPIAVAVPAPDAPVVLDMATASIAWFALIEVARRGERIADDLAVDGNGVPTTDPEAAMAGALLTFGGHKGAGLALMVEMLTGPLVGAGVVGDTDASSNRGLAFVAVRPSALVDKQLFDDAVERLCRRIREGRPVPGGDSVALPGDRSRARLKRYQDAGVIEIDTALLEGLREMAGGEAD